MELTGGTVLLALALPVGGILAIAGLTRPFVGLMVLLGLHFLQPGELFTPLAYLRPELVYGLLLITSYFLQRGTFSDRGKDRARNPLRSSSTSSRAKPIVSAAACLVGAAFLSIPFSVWRGGAVTATVELGKLAVLLFLMSRLIDTEPRLRWVVRLMVGLLLWFSVTGLYTYLSGGYIVREGVDRAVGITSLVGGPNELAGLLLALLPFVLALFLSTSSILLRCFLIAAAVLALCTVVITASRISLFALGAMVLYYVVRSRQAIAGLLLLLVLATLAPVGWILLPQQYKDRYLTVGNYAVGGKLDDSNQLRLQIWKAGLVMFVYHPVLGVGAGQFSTAYGMTLTRHEAWMNPHNLLIQIACELGVVGLLAFGYFLSRLRKANQYVLSFRDDPDLCLNYRVAVACGAMLLGVLVLSCVSHTLYRPYWYLLGGLIAANCNIVEAACQRQTAKAQAEPSAAFHWNRRMPVPPRPRIARPSWVS